MCYLYNRSNLWSKKLLRFAQICYYLRSSTTKNALCGSKFLLRLSLSLFSVVCRLRFCWPQLQTLCQFQRSIICTAQRGTAKGSSGKAAQHTLGGCPCQGNPAMHCCSKRRPARLELHTRYIRATYALQITAKHARTMSTANSSRPDCKPS